MALSVCFASQQHTSTGFIQPQPTDLGTLPETQRYGPVFQKVPGENDILPHPNAGLCRYLAQVYHLMATDTDQTLKTPAVLLLGASSQIGVFAIPQLLLAGFRVLAVSRKGRPEGFPDVEPVDWLNETEALQAAESCQYLLSAGPLKLAKKILTTSKNHTRHPGLDPGPISNSGYFQQQQR